jgi:thiamine biosynthesis lipoprotein
LGSCSSLSYVNGTSTVFSSSIVSTVSVYGGGAAIEECEDVAKALNNSINPYLSSSFVARFNAMGTGEIEVDEYVFDLFTLSKTYYDLSFGAFDPTLSALSELWSVDSRSLSEAIADPDSVFLPSYADVCAYSSGMDYVSAREENGKYYLAKTSAAVKLDFGGIAKGYLTDLYANIMSQNAVSSALCDVSGNLYLKGKRIVSGEKRAWKIGVANCFDAGGAYLTGLTSKGDEFIITSGSYERYYLKDGVKYCHIIDSFSGMPVGVEYADGYVQSESYPVSVTVIGNSGAKCDALATAVCVLGAQRGAELLSSLSLNALIVTSDGKYKVVGDISLMQGYLLEELVAL